MNPVPSAPLEPPADLDRIFGALSDPTRRALLARLRAGPASVSALAEPFAMSLPAVSRHLRVLEEAGLVRREVQGRVHCLHLAAGPLQSAEDWLAAYRIFWEDRLDRLASFVEQLPAEGGEDDGPR